jgi:hypothetical protein
MVPGWMPVDEKLSTEPYLHPTKTAAHKAVDPATADISKKNSRDARE